MLKKRRLLTAAKCLVSLCSDKATRQHARPAVHPVEASNCIRTAQLTSCTCGVVFCSL